MKSYMKTNDAVDFFTTQITDKVAINFKQQTQPTEHTKLSGAWNTVGYEVRELTRWLNIQYDNLDISVTYFHRNYYIFSTINSVEKFMTVDDIDDMYIEVMSLLDNLDDDTYNDFVTRL